MTSTAQVLSDLSVCPDGVADACRVQVNSNADDGVLPGLRGTDNLPANAVQIVLPVGLSAPDCATKAGGECTAISTGTTKRFIFRAATANLGIPEGGSFEFAFRATALSPGSRNRTESLQVQTSDNRGNSFSNAAATGRGLSITTRVLELLRQELVVLTGSLPAAGGDAARATTGQVARVSFDVRSYAANPVTLRPSLATNDADVVSQHPADQTAAPGATVSFSCLVDLGGAAATRNAAMTASAANTADAATSSGQAVPATHGRAGGDPAGAEDDFSPRRVAEGAVSDTLTLVVDKDEVPAVNDLPLTLNDVLTIDASPSTSRSGLWGSP